MLSPRKLWFMELWKKCFLEKAKRKHANVFHVTVKATVLKNDRSWSNLIVASCCYQKSLYIIFPSITKVCGAVEQVYWLKVSLVDSSDDYNYELDDDDIADQKILWALLTWGIEVLISPMPNAILWCTDIVECVKIDNYIINIKFLEFSANTLWVKCVICPEKRGPLFLRIQNTNYDVISTHI